MGSLPSGKCICTYKFVACKDDAIAINPSNYAYLPEARILIFKILAFFFQKETINGHVFASIAFVMTTALVMGVTTPKTPTKEAIAVRKGYKKIVVYFPDAEYEAFLKKVKRTNLSISAFVRKMAAEKVIREAPHVDVPYLMREVKRVGNNLNQLLFLGNTKRP